MAEFKIAIIGAGVTGLALANLLVRQNVDVTLFEQSASLTSRIDCVLLQPTGLACLASMGLDEEIIVLGARIDRHVGTTVTGRNILDLGFGDLGEHLFGLGVLRSVLFSCLYDEVQQSAIAIRTNYIVVDTPLTTDGKRVVIRDAGEEAGPFDLVVDASGQGSQLSRRYGVSGADGKNTRGVLSGLFKDPDQKLCSSSARHHYLANGAVVSVLPVGQGLGDDMHHGALITGLPTMNYAHWRAQGFDKWRAGIAQNCGDIAPIMNQFERPEQFTFFSNDARVLKRFAANGLVFIGDAAHAMGLPLGQGVNLNLVDAVVLAKALKKTPSIAYALGQYNELRRNHIRYYHRTSKMLAPLFQSTGRLTGVMRNLVIKPVQSSAWMKTLMLETFSGVKTGMSTTLDPASWHERYHYLPK